MYTDHKNTETLFLCPGIDFQGSWIHNDTPKYRFAFFGHDMLQPGAWESIYKQLAIKVCMQEASDYWLNEKNPVCIISETGSGNSTVTLLSLPTQDLISFDACMC